MNWGRIVIGAVLIEAILIAGTLPFAISGDMDTVIALAVPGCFVVTFFVAWWLLRKVTSGHLMKGLLMAILATAIYFVLILSQPDGSITSVIDLYGLFLFLLANGLRLLGGVAGGLFAQRRQH